MKVDNVLILAAGKGTRMGEVGKLVPKVIWPIFNKSILELEVDYAKKFSPSNIFINLYNYKKSILDFAKNKSSFNDVTFVEENEKLDIGGAVHNIAKKLSYKGNLLIINSDQFIMLNKELISKFEGLSKSSDAVLLVYSVDPKAGYGGVEIDGDKFTGLISKSESAKREELLTYTGMSLINLECLTPKEGESKFFDSVVNHKELNVKVLNIDDATYWDFGTLLRYRTSIEKLRSSKDEFVKFLKDANVKVDTEASGRINENFYLKGERIIFKKQMA